VTTNPLRTANRSRRRALTVGGDPDGTGPGPVCVLCGESRLFALHTRQGHHVAGRHNDPELTVPLCLNCHAAQTEAHRRVGVRLRDDPVNPPTMVDRLAETLAGASVFLLGLGSRLGDWAVYLRAVVTTLDDQQPGWRDKVGSIPGPVGVTIPAYPLRAPDMSPRHPKGRGSRSEGEVPPVLVPGFPASEVDSSEEGGTHDL